MQIENITPEQADELLNKNPSAVYLDVRTESEFVAGRAPQAINIPVAVVDPATGQMQLNPNFLGVVTRTIDRNADLVVGCKAGPRSEAACQLLTQAGYTAARNLAGGFSGMCDQTGQVLVEGWSTLGLPTCRGDAGDKSYAALLARAAEESEAEGTRPPESADEPGNAGE